MRLRICTRNPTRIHTSVSVPDFVCPFLLPDAVPRYILFDEGWMWSQHFTGSGFRVADFHVSLQEGVQMIPETDTVNVLVAYLLRGNASGVLHSMPGPLRFAQNHAYLLQLIPGPGNELYLEPGDYRVLVFLFEQDIQNTLLHEYPRLQPSYREEQASTNGGLPYPPVPIGVKEMDLISSIIPYKGKPHATELFLGGPIRLLLCELIVRLDAADVVPQNIRKVRDYILANLHRRPSADELSRLVAMNPNHLARVFKASCGMTLKAYALDERMRYVCALLEEPHVNMKEVIGKVGYRQLSNFCGDFRRWAGCSLTEYIKHPRSPPEKSVFR